MNEESIIDLIETKSDWSVLEVTRPFQVDAVCFHLVNDKYEMWTALSALEIMECYDSTPEFWADQIIKRADQALQEHKLTIN